MPSSRRNAWIALFVLLIFSAWAGLYGLPYWRNLPAFLALDAQPLLMLRGNRTDLGAGLGTSAGFTVSGNSENAVLVGDVPLREDEVDAFLRLSLEMGLEISSLHNRFTPGKTNVLSAHVSAVGNGPKLVADARKLFAAAVPKSSLARSEFETLSETSMNISPDTELLAGILGQGTLNHGAFRIAVGRGTRLGDRNLGGATGIETWAEFIGPSTRAMVNGEIATLEPELSETVDRLLKGSMHVVSIHSHLRQETPRVVFVHFWGVGALKNLAENVHAIAHITENHQSN